MLCGQLCAGARGGVFDGMFGGAIGDHLRSFAVRAFLVVLCDAALRERELARDSR